MRKILKIFEENYAFTIVAALLISGIAVPLNGGRFAIVESLPNWGFAVLLTIMLSDFWSRYSPRRLRARGASTLGCL